MSKCLLLDPVTGDLRRERGRFVRGDDVVQRLVTRLRMLEGEWFLDLGEGTPFFQTVLRANVNLNHVRVALIARALGTEGVESVQSLDLQSDFVRRKLTAVLVAVGPNGPVQVAL